jgi:hypothetical protein
MLWPTSTAGALTVPSLYLLAVRHRELDDRALHWG